MGQVKVNDGYELYQIITDFGNPLEIFREAIQNSYDEEASDIYINVYENKKLNGNEIIIDVTDNGNGLQREKISSFFDVANSTKINKNYESIGKFGYKGHGSKVFFNSKKVLISSRTKNGDQWAVELSDPLGQIAEGHKMEYSDFIDDLNSIDMELPEEWESGFKLRIIAPKAFGSKHTWYKLNHIYLRDYCTWFSLVGSVRFNNNDTFQNRTTLFLKGLMVEQFEKVYSDFKDIDPIPTFEKKGDNVFEKIKFGHYFPEERKTKASMEKYSNKCDKHKAFYTYYSRMIFNEEISADSFSFRLIINLEGYETKRRYDILLSRKGKTKSDGPTKEMTHTDGERYGLWACKGGVPIEKVDDWIIGSKGVGTNTYMQAFVDCDEFHLTANRGSIRNTDTETLDIIQGKINEIFSSEKVKEAIKEREELESREKIVLSVESDKKDLKKRYSDAKKRKKITLPNGVEIIEPSKTKSGGYSESETFVVLLTVMEHYPELFPFKIMDYNTTKGIDFVVDINDTPKYIELKGTLTQSINHPFQYIYKFICYDIDIGSGSIVVDIEDVEAELKTYKDKFNSKDEEFKGKEYTSYKLEPRTENVQSMGVIVLKELLTDILNAKISL